MQILNLLLRLAVRDHNTFHYLADFAKMGGVDELFAFGLTLEPTTRQVQH